MADLKGQLVALERQTWEALKTSTGALVPFVTEDCIMIFPGGTIFTFDSSPPLKEVLNRRDMKPWLEYEMSNMHVLELARGVASITYEVEASREGMKYHALITSVWREHGQGWKMCLHQQTPV